MRSLSNLLKFHSVYCENSEKRVIDYNELIASRIVERAWQEKHADGQEAFPVFCEGLVAGGVAPVPEYDETKARAEEILEDAKKEAAGILEHAREEAERIKEQGFKQGKQQGYEEGHSAAIARAMILQDELQDELLKARQTLEEEYQKKAKELEPMLMDTLVDIFEKIFMIQFGERKEMIINIIRNAAGRIETSTEFVVRVSPEDYASVVKKKDFIMRHAANVSSMEVVEDLTLTKNRCIIETADGIYDCSLDTQLEGLVRDLKTLSCL